LSSVVPQGVPAALLSTLLQGYLAALNHHEAAQIHACADDQQNGGVGDRT